MSDGGKGSTPRPLAVSHEEYSRRWDYIFARDVGTQAEEFIQSLSEDEQDIDPDDPDKD